MNAMTEFFSNAWSAFTAKAKPFVSEWQEFVVWLPGLVLLVLAGYIVLGAFTALPPNVIQELSTLPNLCAFAAAACAFTFLVKRTYMRELSSRQEDALHISGMDGSRGALAVLLVDRAATLVALGMFLYFFRVVR